MKLNYSFDKRPLLKMRQILNSKLLDATTSELTDLYVDLDNIDEILQILNGEFEESVNPIEQAKKDFYKLQIYNSYIMECLRNSTKIKDYSDFPDFEYSRQNFSKSEIFTLTNDFFRDKLPLFYPYYLKFYKEEKNNVIFVPTYSYGGVVYYIKTFRKNYVIVEDFNSIEKLTVFVHEIMHAIATYINFNHVLKKSKIVLSEADSLFAELIAIDYYGNLLDLQKDAEILRAKEFIAMQNYIDGICRKYNILRKIKTVDRNFEANLNATFNNSPEEEMTELFETEIDDDLSYAFGNLVSRELYPIYYDDPELAQHRLKTIVSWQDEENYVEGLREFGIIAGSTSFDTGHSYVKKFIK